MNTIRLCISQLATIFLLLNFLFSFLLTSLPFNFLFSFLLLPALFFYVPYPFKSKQKSSWVVWQLSQNFMNEHMGKGGILYPMFFAMNVLNTWQCFFLQGIENCISYWRLHCCCFSKFNCPLTFHSNEYLPTISWEEL